MKKLLFVWSLLIVASLVLSACGGTSAPAVSHPQPAANPSTSTQLQVTASTQVVFADPDLEQLYQAALSNNPQWTGDDLQKRQMFYAQYGGSAAHDAFAKAYAQEKGGLVFVQAAAVIAAKNPPAWLYALALYAGVNAIIAMQAQEAVNLSLPVIPLDQIADDARILVMAASSVAAAETARQTAAFGETSMEIADGLTPASKVVGGTYAYWDESSNGNCFFGVHSPLGWSAFSLPGPCPSSPDDEPRIAQLLQDLWNYKSPFGGYTWAELISFGGKAAAHVAAFIELAKAYGVTLTP